MSTEKIWGPWDRPHVLPEHGYPDPVTGNQDDLHELWYKLAAQKVGTPDQKNNCGLSQRRAEITTLWEIYRRAKPSVVLEVGVAQGGTFASWCYLGKSDATIIGLDRDVNDCRPRKGEPVDTTLARPHLQDRMTRQGGGMFAYAKDNQRVVSINGWTTDQRVKDELASVLAGRTIDFCFHDASHEATMFHQDFLWLWPLISDGGVFATHDIMPSAAPSCNKSEEWERIKREETYSACMEFRGARTDDSLGIGVLIK